MARSIFDRAAIGSRSGHDQAMIAVLLHADRAMVCRPMKIAAKNPERRSRDALSAV